MKTLRYIIMYLAIRIGFGILKTLTAFIFLFITPLMYIFALNLTFEMNIPYDGPHIFGMFLLTLPLLLIYLLFCESMDPNPSEKKNIGKQDLTQSSKN